MSDAEVREMAEQGRVPLCFTMSKKDMIVSESGPKPVFIHALRSAYIPLLVLAAPQDMSSLNGVGYSNANPSADSNGCILHKFAFFTAASSGGMDALLSDVWFDIAGVPVKWHLPVGVLYDYFMHANGLCEQQHSAVMKVTVHFQNFPKHIVLNEETAAGFGTILRWPTISNVKTQYFYSLKECHFIKHGDIGLINKLGPSQMEQLWKAVQLSDARTFRVVNETLCPTSSSLELKNIPLRVLFDPAHAVAQFGLPAQTATVADVVDHMSNIISHSKNFANTADKTKWILYCNGLRLDDQPKIPLSMLYSLLYSFDNYLYLSYVPAPPSAAVSTSPVSEPTATPSGPSTETPSGSAE